MGYLGRHVAQVRGWPRWLRWSVVLLVLALLGAGSAAGAVWYLSRDLPDVRAVRNYHPSQVTQIYADNNELIGQFYVEKRLVVPLSQVSKVVWQAIVAVEDSRFFEHHGIDPVGILRAFVANLGSFQIRQGASTITQQLARALFLTPERSLTRKIKEALLARKIEHLLTKEEILELYLNQIYFGQGVYGVQAAAQTYFGKDASEITLAEAAFLASLPKAPSDYSPYRHPERAKQRQGVVLRRMVEEGFINQEQFREAYQQDLYFERPATTEEIAPYFIETIRQHLKEKYGDDAVYKGGLRVYTTLNVALQQAANRSVAEGLRDLDKRQGFRGPIGHRSPEEMPAVAAPEGAPAESKVGVVRSAQIKPGDLLDAVVTKVEAEQADVAVGEITGTISKSAMAWASRRLIGPNLEKVEKIDDLKPSDILSVGDVITVGLIKIDKSGKKAVFSLEQEPLVEGSLLSIDPVTGGVKAMVGGYDFHRSEFNRALQARRQPGSAFKPIIYATALEKGLTPSTILIDAPVVYHDPELDKIWKPVNFEERFYGPITLREALIHSRNLATIRLLDQIGIPPVVDLAQRMGIGSPLNRDLSLALGSSSVTLLELTSAYGVFANQGVRVDPMMIRSVTDAQGQILEFRESTKHEVLPKAVAYLMTNLLQDVVQHGTGQRARVLGRPVAGKTGTTNDFTDAWFVGFSPNLAVGVWVGFDDRRSLGDREAGARVALPVWIDFMRSALALLPQATFEIPDEITFAKVDPASGLLAPPDESNAPVEMFVAGTEPTKQPSARPDVTDFYRLDNGGGSAGPIF
jgi:penicillin-binding protein 1A